MEQVDLTAFAEARDPDDAFLETGNEIEIGQVFAERDQSHFILRPRRVDLPSIPLNQEAAQPHDVSINLGNPYSGKLRTG